MRKPKVLLIYGSEGADIIEGSDADENIYAYGGDDIVYGGGGSDYIQGGAGDDQLYGGDGDDRVYGDAGTNKVFGGAGNDHVGGGDGNDQVYGDEGNDRVIGHTGNDELYGGAGEDILIGEWGADLLWGGTGADVFQYGWGFDSTTRTSGWGPWENDPDMTWGPDTIMDFESGIDRIDLSRIDADLTTAVLPPKGKSGAPTGNEAFTVVDAPVSGEPGPGQLTLTYDAFGGTTIQGYMDAQAGADFTLYVATYVAPTDFIL